MCKIICVFLCFLAYYFIDFPAVACIIEGYLVEVRAGIYAKRADGFAALAFLPVVGNGLYFVNFVIPDKHAGIDFTSAKESKDLNPFVQ